MDIRNLKFQIYNFKFEFMALYNLLNQIIAIVTTQNF